MKTVTFTFIFSFFTIVLSAQTSNFNWAGSISGSGDVSPSSVQTDNLGYIYVAGEFSGVADFDPGTETLSLESSGYDDIFIQKLSNQGDLIWAKHIGAAYNDNCNHMIIDASANIYITGSFSLDVDMDPGEGTYMLNDGSDDIYIAKYDSAGNFIWAHAFGSDEIVSDQGASISIDNQGNVLLTGYFQGTIDFDPGVGVQELTAPYSPSCYILKLNENGEFIWAKSITSYDYVEGHTIKTDNKNNIYVSGLFETTTDFDPGTTTSELTPTGDYDAFLLKLDKDGNFKWAICPGGTANNTNLDKKRPFEIDSNGNIILAFHFDETIDLDPKTGVTELTPTGFWSDIFLQKLDSLGNLVWVQQIGGEEDEELGALYIDDQDNIYIGGSYEGTVDFDTSEGTLELSAGLSYNQALFISKYNTDGEIQWGYSTSWSEDDGSWPFGQVFEITTNKEGRILATGQFWDTYNFNPEGLAVNLEAPDDLYSGFILYLNNTVVLNEKYSIDNENIDLYPNPFSNEIRITGNKNFHATQLSVFSVSGQCIYTAQFNENGYKINTENIPKGIYLVKINNEKSEIVKKMIKK